MSGKNIKPLWLLFCQAAVIFTAALWVWEAWQPPAVSYSEAIGRVMPSVAGIYGRRGGTPVAVPRRDSQSIGAGVIVDDRHILTNYHLVANMAAIEADIDGNLYAAELVGVDPEIDIAVLSVHAAHMSPIQFAKEGALKQGDVVFAIGSPFGLSRSASMGIVSATGRSHLGINLLEDFIQTDAAINPGSSGGALANAKGELVGINSFLFARTSGGSPAQGIGFAVPTETIRRSLRDFLPPRRPASHPIGAEARPMSERLHQEVLDDDLDYAPVMLISRLWEGTPAAKMGMQPGDIILEIDDQPAVVLSETGELPLSLQTMVVQRGGERRRLSLEE